MMKSSFALGAGMLCLLLALPANAQPRSLQWDRTFSTSTAPKNVHFTAQYQDATGRMHSQEVWREGRSHLHRRTDNRLDLYVDRQKDGNYRYQLLDAQRRLAVSVSRENLYRIGVFSDWAGLAHVLARPQGKFILTRVAARPEKTALGECRWYQLAITQPHPGKSRICWSPRWGLPLLIQSQDRQHHWTPQFRMTKVEKYVPQPGIFTADTSGLMTVDADMDLNPATD